MYSLLLWLVLILIVGWAWIRFGLSELTAVLALISALVGLLPALKVGPLRWPLTSAESTPDQITDAARRLAVEVGKQWDEEAPRRRLMEAHEMPVRWELEERAARAENLPATGQVEWLVEKFATDPRPMVVIGEPGSGKTGLCVLLVLDLLKNASAARVPVLLQISSWNPERNLDEWLIERLIEDYPFLGNETSVGATAVREIVTQRRVLPVLDGLDEMPEQLRSAALAAIEDSWSSRRPFVLTCRTDEFRSANARNLLVGVRVVRLLPLLPQAAANYLLDAAPDTALEQWEDVLADMIERPAGPLAHSLTKPLMLYLARIAFEREGASPRELLDQRRFGSAERIEEYLLDQFIPTVFRPRDHRLEPNPLRPAKEWTPAQAQRALVFLASFLHTLGTRDLAWWQLHRAVPRPVSHLVRVVLGMLGCGVLGWALFGLFGRGVLGAAFGLGLGFLAGLPLGRVQDKKPRRFVPRLLRRREFAPEFVVRDIGFGIVGALAGGLIVGLLISVGYGIVIGLFFGLVFGMVRRFTEPTEPREPLSPVNVLKADRSTVLYALSLGAVSGGLSGAFFGGVIGTQSHGLIFSLTRTQETALGAAVGALVGAGGLGMLVHATSAWAQFILARIWLSYRGWTPLRLVTFLQDAHKLGVLRQVGPLYQFRHALLQDRIVARNALPEPRTAPGAALTRTDS